MGCKGKLKIGVVGLGRFVEIAHMPTYFNSKYAENIDVAALCDVSQERLDEWQKKYGVAGGYTSVDEMLDKEDLDAVVIVTPDHLHTEIACKAMESGCDVLIEKPLATDLKECHKVIATAKKTGRRVITDFHKREDPAHQEARYRVIQEKKYGKLQFGNVWMQDAISVPAPGFFKSNFAENSSPVWFLGVHFFDIIRYITDLEPMQIRATGYKQVLKKMGINTFDAVKSDIIFNNGASVSFLLSWNLPEGAPNLTSQGLYLQFENGEMKVDTRDRGMYELSKDGYKTVNPMFTRRTDDGKVAGYGHESIGEALMELLELKECNRSNLADLYAKKPSDRDGFYATLMAQATHESLERGQKSADGDVYIGKIIDVNEFITESLGNDASDYLVTADI